MNLVTRVILLWLLKRRRGKRHSILRQQCLFNLNAILTNSFLCYSLLRVSPTTFRTLYTTLQPSLPHKFVSPMEVCAIGLRFLASNQTIYEQCTFFGFSNEVIRRCRFYFINAVISCFRYQFTLQSWLQAGVFSHEVEVEEFDGCFGAIDGTHIPVRVSVDESEKYRN